MSLDKVLLIKSSEESLAIRSMETSLLIRVSGRLSAAGEYGSEMWWSLSCWSFPVSNATQFQLIFSPTSFTNGALLVLSEILPGSQ